MPELRKSIRADKRAGPGTIGHRQRGARRWRLTWLGSRTMGALTHPDADEAARLGRRGMSEDASRTRAQSDADDIAAGQP